MTDLFHYTCAHSARRIGRRGLLLPLRLVQRDAAARLGVHAWLAELVWLTTLPEPDINATGLTSRGHGCDRLEYQYRVLTPGRAQPWIGSRWHGQHPDWGDPGDDPATWWVSDRALTAVQVTP